MASEPVLSSEVGNRTSLVVQPVMVISAMVAVVWFVTGVFGVGRGRGRGRSLSKLQASHNMVYTSYKFSSNSLTAGDPLEVIHHHGKLTARPMPSTSDC